MDTMQKPTQDQLHKGLKEDIEDADPGIAIEPLIMPWGSLVTLTRQGQSTKWRVWLYNSGASKLSHIETATLPAVEMVFEPGQILNLRDAVTYFINRGWI